MDRNQYQDELRTTLSYRQKTDPSRMEPEETLQDPHQGTHREPDILAEPHVSQRTRSAARRWCEPRRPNALFQQFRSGTDRLCPGCCLSYQRQAASWRETC